MTTDPVRVTDQRVGELWFSGRDRVVAPAIARSGVWEPLEGLWLDLVLRPGMTVVNAGANVGYFALWAAQRVGPTGRVIAIEPHPENCALLRRNVAEHGCSCVVEVIEAAASSQPGTITLYVNDVNAGDHRVYDPAVRTSTAALSAQAAGFPDRPRSLEVPAVRLDDVLGGRHVDVMLTDTQGWDHEVLRGTSAALRRDRPLVLSEFVPEWIEANGSDPGIVLAELIDLGFDVGAWDAGAAPGEWSLDHLVTWARDRWFTNIELWPRERPLAPRARPSEGFWPIERAGGHDRHWLTSPSGRVRLAGPPSWAGAFMATLVPPRGFTATVRLGSDEFVVAEATGVRVDVELDSAGRAGLPVTVSTPARQVSGDPRTLYVAVLDPLLG